jgi:transcriptional regulator with XRE-family HTH domain
VTHKRASDFVADRLRQIRQRRGLTAEGLAARCAEIGAPEITRSVIANIETGRRGPDGRRRREVSVDELLIFAYALQVPPALLVVPLDGAEELEVTVDVRMDVLKAAAWMTGDDQAPGFYGTEPARPRQDSVPLALLRQISAALSRAQLVRQASGEQHGEDSAAMRNIAKEIARVNDWLASLGFAPPELPPEMGTLVQHAAAAAGEGG